MARLIVLLALISIANAAIVMIGSVAYDTKAMATKINQQIDKCFKPEAGETNGQAFDGDCGCALDKKEFCFSFTFETFEDFRCATLPAECVVEDAAPAGADPAAGAAPSGGATAGATPSPADRDKFRRWHAYCCFWADSGNCAKAEFKTYMVTVCQEACGTVGCRQENLASPECQPKPTPCNKEAAAATTPAAGATTAAAGATTPAATTAAGAATPTATTVAPAATTAAQKAVPGVVGQPSNPASNPSSIPTAPQKAAPGVVGQPSNPAVTGGIGRAPGCDDSDERCAFWTFVGECTKNPQWMNPNCAKSCRQC